MNLFKLEAKLGLDTSEYTKNVKTAGSDISDLKNKIHNGFNAIKKASIALAGAGATLFGSMAKIGLDYNSQMESYTTNFETMLGSTEAAAAKVEELKKMAAKTPFGMGDLANATQTLLAFQVPAEKSTDILRMLGDVALGDKEKMKGLALVFGQVSSAGKLQGQDLMQMINQGFNPLNYISERTGESMEELRDRMSKGAVSAEEVEQAFRDATSEGGQFYNGMEKASQTTQGLVSTLKDAVNSKAGEFFGSLSGKIKEVIPHAISFVENLDVDKVKGKLEDLKQTFKKLLPVIAGVTGATVAYKAAVSIAGIIDLLRKATEGQTIAQAALNAVMNANPFVLVATVIAGVVTAIITLWHTNDNFKNAVINAWTAVKNFFTEKIPAAFNSVVDYVKQIPGKIAQFGAQMLAAAIELYTNLKDGIREGFLELLTLVGTWVTENIVQPIKDKFADFKSAGKEMIGKVKEGISEAWKGLKDWFNNLWDGLFGNRNVDVNVNGNYNTGGRQHAGGLAYVPYNGYAAELHRGEAVLTARQADEWRRSDSSKGGITIVQNIQAIARTPVEFASATEAYFEQARWTI